EHVDIHQLAVLQIEVHYAIQRLRDVPPRNRGEAGVGATGDQTIEDLLQRCRGREQFVGINLVELGVDLERRVCRASVNGDCPIFLSAEEISGKRSELNHTAVQGDIRAQIVQ